MLNLLKRQQSAPAEHHPIILKFGDMVAAAQPKWSVGFMDILTDLDFMPAVTAEHTRQYRQISLPTFTEEYFEWVDVFEAVDQAKDSFTMLELGAGFGRWGVIGYMAAKMKGIKNIKVGFVEAEPQHVVWLKEHVQVNGMKPDQYAVYPCAVSDHNGEILFYIGMPEGSDSNSPREWYGQCIVSDSNPIVKNAANDQDYHGFPVVSLASGWTAVRVPLRDINEILADYNYLDLIDMDVQGEELKIVQAGMQALNQKVKRIHIGTHNAKVESGMRKLFTENGWTCVWDYACGRRNQTPYGMVDFCDGVQGWINPKFKD